MPRPDAMLTIRDRLRPWSADLVFFGIVLVLIVTWVIAIPRWASPDEPAHVYKAYGTAHGELLGNEIDYREAPSNIRRFDGPASLGLGNLHCYIAKVDVPAGCDGDLSVALESTAARYPPFYYAVVGGAARLADQSTSVRTYRLVSAMLCAAALAAAFALVRRSRSRRLAPLMLVALTPMALFMLGSVNPNATEIAGFVLIWALLVRLCTDDELSMRLTLATSVVAGALVLSRPISAGWMIAVAIVALIAVDPKRRREFLRRGFLVRLLVPIAISAVASLAWLRYAAFEVGDETVATNLKLGEVLRISIDNWPEYYRQTIGVLGWLDTRVPWFTYLGWSIALVAVAVIYLIRSTARQWLTLAAIVAAWLALPLVINAVTAAPAGLSFQGRYSLPILAGLAFLPMFDTRHNRSPGATTALMYPAIAIVAIAEIGGFWQMLRRFSVGANGKIVLTDPLPWQPSIAPMVLIAINAIAMVALGVDAVMSTRRPLVQADGSDSATTESQVVQPSM